MGDSTNKIKAWLSWSSGKDSAWALHVARQQGEFEVAALLTTITDKYSRVSMHGVREELLERQAEAAGLPLVKIYIPSPCTNEVYEQKMAEAMTQAQSDGIRHVLFGDLFLEDVRNYRVEKLGAVDMEAVFPVWGLDTARLAREMIGSGLRAHITCLDPKQIDAGFAGREFDASLLASLPETADPCGENGEFHTLCTAGPMFSRPVQVIRGETVERDGFVFTDFLLDGAAA